MEWNFYAELYHAGTGSPEGLTLGDTVSAASQPPTDQGIIHAAVNHHVRGNTVYLRRVGFMPSAPSKVHGLRMAACKARQLGGCMPWGQYVVDVCRGLGSSLSHNTASPHPAAPPPPRPPDPAGRAHSDATNN